MSSSARKLQKKKSEQKSQGKGESKSSTAPPGDIGQALEKFFRAEEERSRLMRELDTGVMVATNSLIECVKNTLAGQKLLEQTLQDTRRKYQTVLDDISFAQEKIRELQAANTKLEQDKLKVEQKLQWAKVELQVTKDELKRVEEKVSLEAELDHWEDEISHCERKLAKQPHSSERYESRLKAAQEARDRCLERIKQLQEANDAENFNEDSPFGLLSEESNAILWEYVNGRDPTDEVIIRNEEDEARLLATWGAGDTSFVSAKTVPLEDYVITFATANFSARTIFNSDDSAGVLIIETELAGLPKRIKLAFFIRTTGDNLALSADLGYDNLLADEKKLIESKLTTSFGKAFLELGYKVLSLWYAVERALLHPPIREYIAGRNLEKNDGQGAGRDENVVTYVKCTSITVDDLMIGNEPKVVNWHVDKWGVVGHWREYSNGKKVWVRPHEKGRKRGQKLDNQDLRERIIPNA